MSTRSRSILLFALALLVSIGAQPVSHTEMESTSTRRPSLVAGEVEPMRYHFVTEHRPTSLGQNYYLKPGQLVGSVSLDSDILQVRHDQLDGKPVASKHNILFVAYTQDPVDKPGSEIENRK
ncbi:uncharacterized protein LOC108023906 [Drosophila biarmipes]|uniref:uncharacterized protein LOC108023906 n=1 Tax=Drosophila biarmipes TaxID=125945 RepID=UPI0007E6E3F7|nr:uncharacterized protein LOC108023906 [Drosophila biarmipes]